MEKQKKNKRGKKRKTKEVPSKANEKGIQESSWFHVIDCHQGFRSPTGPAVQFKAF